MPTSPAPIMRSRLADFCDYCAGMGYIAVLVVAGVLVLNGAVAALLYVIGF